MCRHRWFTAVSGGEGENRPRQGEVMGITAQWPPELRVSPSIHLFPPWIPIGTRGEQADINRPPPPTLHFSSWGLPACIFRRHLKAMGYGMSYSIWMPLWATENGLLGVCDITFILNISLYFKEWPSNFLSPQYKISHNSLKIHMLCEAFKKRG